MTKSRNQRKERKYIHGKWWIRSTYQTQRGNLMYRCEICKKSLSLRGVYKGHTCGAELNKQIGAEIDNEQEVGEIQLEGSHLGEVGSNAFAEQEANEIEEMEWEDCVYDEVGRALGVDRECILNNLTKFLRENDISEVWKDLNVSDENVSIKIYQTALKNGDEYITSTLYKRARDRIAYYFKLRIMEPNEVLYVCQGNYFLRVQKDEYVLRLCFGDLWKINSRMLAEQGELYKIVQSRPNYRNYGFEVSNIDRKLISAIDDSQLDVIWLFGFNKVSQMR
eukprot:TRINITY_DN8063_c0_g2_i6.p1 TRINITY_DN8063_c0_g2~~TRINITY_DN8063_c0_g2_i6.p1  ORF type:complete len:279 (-),score=24.27 TRINITY_DN8063_c0_g2_i6:670-1506(-)